MGGGGGVGWGGVGGGRGKSMRAFFMCYTPAQQYLLENTLSTRLPLR